MAQLCPFQVIPRRRVVEMSQYTWLEQYLSTRIGQIQPARTILRRESSFRDSKVAPLAPDVLRRHIGAGPDGPAKLWVK